MATTTRWPCHPLHLSQHHHRFSTLHYRRRRYDVTVRAFGRGDIDGFMRRIASGEALKDAWRGANEGAERLAFEARLAAQRIDRKYSVSRRLDEVARSAAVKAREIDAELGIGRSWKSFTADFSRNWPRVGYFYTPCSFVPVTIAQEYFKSSLLSTCFAICSTGESSMVTQKHRLAGVLL